jgi:hypothetical protein
LPEKETTPQAKSLYLLFGTGGISLALMALAK